MGLKTLLWSTNLHLFPKSHSCFLFRQSTRCQHVSRGSYYPDLLLYLAVTTVSKVLAVCLNSFLFSLSETELRNCMFLRQCKTLQMSLEARREITFCCVCRGWKSFKWMHVLQSTVTHDIPLIPWSGKRARQGCIIFSCSLVQVLLAGPNDGQIPILILRLQNDVGKQMHMDN